MSSQFPFAHPWAPIDGVVSTAPIDGVVSTAPIDGVVSTAPIDGVVSTEFIRNGHPSVRDDKH